MKEIAQLNRSENSAKEGFFYKGLRAFEKVNYVTFTGGLVLFATGASISLGATIMAMDASQIYLSRKIRNRKNK